MIWICMLLFYIHHFVDCTILPLTFTKLQLPPNVTGPESLAFDKKGGGPYTGVSDGRILKYQGPNVGFVDYATTSPNRTKQQCDGTNGTAAATCGRPFGLGIFYRTNETYAVDLIYGLVVVGPNGGPATQIAAGFNGTRFALPNALDIDQLNQKVYFTDSGSIFLTMSVSQIIQSNDNSGKLYQYDIRNKQLSLLLSGLYGPTGVAVSATGEYVLVSEYIKTRLRRYWVKGSLAGSSEILANLSGSPDNIKRTSLGDFWVPVTNFDRQNFQVTSYQGQRINDFSGNVVDTVNLTAQYYTDKLVSEVQEYGGKLFIGSGIANFVGVYDRP